MDDRKKREEIILRKPNGGLYLDNLVWYEMHNFKKNTILLVLASEHYNENDYIRSYFDFRKIKKS